MINLNQALSMEIENTLTRTKTANVADRFYRAGCPLRNGLTDVRAELTAYMTRQNAAPEDTGPSEIDVTTLRGYEVWRSMHNTFRDVGLNNLSYQMRFRDKIMLSLLPMIYSENNEWAIHRNAIMRHHAIKRVYIILAMVCARQMGKSTVIAQVLAAFTIHCAKRKVFVISIAQKQADNLRSLYLRCIESLEGGNDYIVRKTSKLLMVSPSKGRIAGDACTLTFAASTALTSRGEQVDVAIIDEAGFVKDSTFSELIAPLLQVVGVIGIMISSPPPHQNFFTRILEAKNKRGEKVADCEHLTQACQLCIDAGKHSCPHKENEAPPWKNDPERAEELSMLCPDTKTAQREMLGAIRMDDIPAFHPGFIKAMAESVEVNITRPPEGIILSIDPSGGGSQSDAGIIVLAVDITDGTKILVLGGGSVPMGSALDQTVVNAIRAILVGLRSNRHIAHVPIAVAIEGNLNMLAATNLANHLVQIDRDLILMSETRGGRNERVNGPYVLLDPVNGKDRYVRHASAYLHNFAVRWGTGISTHNRDPAAFKFTLIDQLSNFLLTIQDDTNGLRPAKRIYSGKQSGRKDDLCMAFLQGLYQLAIYMASPAYSRRRRGPTRQIYGLGVTVDSALTREAAEIIAESLSYDPVRNPTHVERIPFSPANPHARRV